MEDKSALFFRKTYQISGHESKPIYPEIWGVQNDVIGRIEFRTFLRKKHTDGKYYLQMFYRTFHFELNEPLDAKDKIIATLKQIHTEVYNNLICGIIDTGLKSAIFGEPVFELDQNQEEESERIKKQFI